LVVDESYLGWLVWSLCFLAGALLFLAVDFFIFWGVEMIWGVFLLCFFLTSNARITKVLGKGGVQANAYIVAHVFIVVVEKG
jgi:hypothetical protein